MSDTIQGVSWAIERKCPIRDGTDWQRPNVALHQTGGLRNLASARRDRRLVNDIVVTSYSMETDNSGEFFSIPCDVYRVSKLVEGFGGVDQAERGCANCEAHVTKDVPGELAGCCDFMGDISNPYDPDLDTALNKALDATGMRQKWEQAFIPTSLVWFSFWIKSPLTRAQCEIMLPVFEHAFELCTADEKETADVRRFVAALRVCLAWELRLHVYLPPLGHVDCGWDTVFPHCPRCKAKASLPPWQESYSSTPEVCRVCQFTFNPAETFKQERMDYDFDSNSIDKVLGDEAEEFVRAYLIHQGASPAQAQEVLDNRNLVELNRKIRKVRERQRDASKTLHSIPQDNAPPTLILELGKGEALELILAPAGEFMMGGADDETSLLKVKFDRPFYIGKYPVTQAQWRAVMSTNPSLFKGARNLPVDRVSWLTAQEFCWRAGSIVGRPLRLPTEAEWEYACRAGTTTRFAFGERLTTDQANFNGEYSEGECKGIKRGRTTPVDYFKPNAWGIYDMHGNVQEWCEDIFSGSRKEKGREAFRVLRGGSYSHGPGPCESGARAKYRADAGDPDVEENEPSQDCDVEDPIHSILGDFFMPTGLRVALSVS